MAGPAPLYGTWVSSFSPVACLNCSAARCVIVPVPAEPYDSLPGLALAYSTNSLSVFTGSAAFTTHATDATHRIEIGTKSLIGS